MDQILSFRDSILGYISPARYRRRHSTSTTTPTNNFASLNRPLKPDLDMCFLFNGRKKRNGRAVLNGRVERNRISPNEVRRGGLPRTNGGSKASQASYSHDGVSHNSQDVSIIEETTHLESVDPESVDPGSVDTAEVDPNRPTDPETSAGDKVTAFLAQQSGTAPKRNDDKSDWHQGEIALFEELSMRGLQPLLPSQWRPDFRTCPPALFSPNIDETFLNSASGQEFRASTALVSLVTLGGRVRSVLTGSRSREQIIKKEIDSYLKWSEIDGGYRHKTFLPIITVVAGKPGQPIGDISRIMTDQLNFLAEQHREALVIEDDQQGNGAPAIYSREPPLLYGIIIAGAIAVFVTLDSAQAGAVPRTISHFDFDQRTMDVWNGFAIAIMIVFVRNYMISIKEHLDDEEQEDDDPDA